MNNITNEFINEIFAFAHDSLTQDVQDQVKLSLIDILGCIYAGNAMAERSLNYIGRNVICSGGEVSLIGEKRRAGASDAAFYNGFSAHVAELDDGHRYAMMHPGAAVFPPLLAFAQKFSLPWEDFVKGAATGYEAAIRLSSAIQPGHKLLGFHGTGTCGTIGAALGLAAAMDLPIDKWKGVLSAAATSAAGLLETMDDESQLKPYNVAQSCSSAINAYMAGAAGLRGPDDILGGKRGFFATHAKEVAENLLTEGIDNKAAISLIYRKPYAACRHCHAPIDGALAIMKENRINIRNIKKIRVETYGLAVKGHDHKNIRGVSSAKMSIPYSVAAAILLGRADLDSFSEKHVSDPNIIHLAQKVDVVESAQLSALVPKIRGAIIIIEEKNRQYKKRIDYPRGEPENPMTENEIKEKTRLLMQYAGINTEKADQIMGYLNNADEEFVKFLEAI